MIYCIEHKNRKGTGANLYLGEQRGEICYLLPYCEALKFDMEWKAYAYFLKINDILKTKGLPLLEEDKFLFSEHVECDGIQ